MSDKILITEDALAETIRCAICHNSNKTERGCDGSCQYDKELLTKIVEAVTGIAEKRPHGEWIPFEWDDYYTTKIPLPKGSDSRMEEYWDEEFMCSVCGKAHHARDFCPYCGADMREGGDS